MPDLAVGPQDSHRAVVLRCPDLCHLLETQKAKCIILKPLYLIHQAENNSGC